MDFAQAKIHSLVAELEYEGNGQAVSSLDPETMKFKEVESRFLQQFNMPEEEKLVNCECSLTVCCPQSYVSLGLPGFVQN